MGKNSSEVANEELNRRGEPQGMDQKNRRREDDAYHLLTEIFSLFHKELPLLSLFPFDSFLNRPYPISPPLTLLCPSSSSLNSVFLPLSPSTTLSYPVMRKE